MRPIYTLPAPPVQLDARALARALGGDLAAPDSILAPGPGHSPRDRSLSIKLDAHAPDGFTVYSHAGDDWKACRDHVNAAAGIERERPAPAPSPRPARPARDDQDRTRRALSIWREAQPLADTLGEAYLRTRGRWAGLDFGALDNAIRFAPTCPWKRSAMPCLVALMRDPATAQPTGVQRTPIAADGTKHPDGRMMLGAAGCTYLTQDRAGGPALLVESLEDGLVLLQHWPRAVVWVAHSADNIGKFPAPAFHTQDLTIVGDGGDAGERAVARCLSRWRDAGLPVRAVVAPAGADPDSLLGGR